MKTKKCWLCGSDEHKALFHCATVSGNGYKISQPVLDKPLSLIKCNGCGLVTSVTNIKNIDLEYENYEDELYLSEERGRRKSAIKILKRLGKLKRPGNILEIGCSVGYFLDEAKKKNWDVTGVELSKWASNYARKNFSINVINQSIEKANLPDQHFDVIVLLDVIEHIKNPACVLEILRKALKNNGIIYISTPDHNSFFSRILKEKWWGVNSYHINYFTKKTLDKLFERTGYKKKKYYSHTRYFSNLYLSKRITSYSKFVGEAWGWLARKTFLGKLCLPLKLRDQLDVIAVKKRTISDFDDTQINLHGRDIKKDAKVFVVLPAYNAAKTLPITIRDIPKDIVNKIILVDDCSTDNTVEVAKSLGIEVIKHKKNTGYGGNQKTCYKAALEQGADIVVMVHPDYQYDPKVIPHMVDPIIKGEADACFGSRMLKGGTLEGGMPKWKHNANILLTAFENVVLGVYLSEYHTGFRAYSADLLKTINFEANSDKFVFDTEIIVQTIIKGFKIEEVPIRTRYFDEASKIKLWPSTKYGLGILLTMLKYLLHTKTFFKVLQFK